MKNSKTVTLLASFSANDLVRFHKYLSSPYFNENPELLKLFGLLVQEVIPASGSVKTKGNLWEELFPKTPYHDQTLRRLLSELTGKALSFIACERFFSDPLEEAAAKLPSLLDPHLGKHFDGVLRQVNIIRDRAPDHSPSAFYHLYLIERSRHHQLEAAEKKPNTLRFLESADLFLDSFYFVQKLKNHCDALGYQKTLALEANLHLIPGFLEYLRQSHYAAMPLVKAYLLVYEMLERPEEDSAFQALRSLLREEGSRFEKGEQNTLFIHLMNFCIDNRINRGRTEYYDELFALYQVALEKKIILEDGVLDAFHYKNIITIGLRVNALDWTERFIQQYTPLLSDSSQANALTYNLAKVYFQQERYDKVIEQLREVEYQDLVYSLGAKRMLLKTYFQMNEFLPLDSLSDSFRIFLQRNRLISREVKQQYLNFLRFVKKLSNIRPGDSATVEKVRGQVEACQALPDKTWILEKLSEF